MVGIHYADFSKERLIGFRLFETSSKAAKDVDLQSVFKFLQEGRRIENLRLKDRSKAKSGGMVDLIEGSQGSIDKYPFFVQRKPLGEQDIIVILAKDPDEPVYIIYSSFVDKILGITEEKLLERLNEKTAGNGDIAVLANGKVVNRGNTRYIASKAGQFVSEKIVKKPKKISKEGLKVAKNPIGQASTAQPSQSQSDEKRGSLEIRKYRRKVVHKVAPDIPMNELKCSHNDKMTVEQKLIRSFNAIKEIRPFYAATLSVIPKVESNSIEVPTAGVTATKYYFNPEFISKLTESELVFVNMHEASHISLLHPARGRGKNTKVFNVACDLFINRMLCLELGLNKLGDTVSLGEKGKLKVTAPIGVLYDERIDITKDTAESIYRELMKENSEKLSRSDSSGEKKPQNGKEDNEDNTEGNGNQEGNLGGESPIEGESEKQAQRGKGQGQDQGQGQGQGRKQGKGKNTGRGQGQGRGQGNGQEQADGQEQGQGQGQGQGQNNNLTFRGRDLGVDGTNDGKMTMGTGDLIEDEDSDKVGDDGLKQQSKNLVNRADTVAKMWGLGAGGSLLEKLAIAAIAPKVGWRSVLRKKLTGFAGKVSTYAAPDRRFLSRNMILPGPKAMEMNKLDGIKIAIDTSGSISRNELEIALAQIQQLLKLYKAEAEALYWDTAVANTGRFKDIKGLLDIRPAGGGGTDPNCIYEYFEKMKKKPSRGYVQPSVVVVFTDGYFGEINPKFKRYDTIWIISKNGDRNFKPPFGIVAPIIDDD